MLHLATLMERHVEEFALHRPVKIVEEFADTLEKEIDYTIEAGSMERMARLFLNDPTVYIPAVYRELTTPRILTMEFVEGIKISEVERLERAPARQFFQDEPVDAHLVLRRTEHADGQNVAILGAARVRDLARKGRVSAFACADVLTVDPDLCEVVDRVEHEKQLLALIDGPRLERPPVPGHSVVAGSHLLPA